MLAQSHARMALSAATKVDSEKAMTTRPQMITSMIKTNKRNANGVALAAGHAFTSFVGVWDTAIRPCSASGGLSEEERV